MKTRFPLFLLPALALAFTDCRKAPPKAATAVATSPEHGAFLEESAREAEAKKRLNEKLRDAMNLQLAAARKQAGNTRLTWNDVVAALPSPAVEIMSGRSSITASADGSGGWWWDEKNQRLEINRME